MSSSPCIPSKQLSKSTPTLAEKQAELAYLLSLRDASAAILDSYHNLHRALHRLKSDASENYRLFKLWSEVMRNAGQINTPHSNTAKPDTHPPLFVKIPRK